MSFKLIMLQIQVKENRFLTLSKQNLTLVQSLVDRYSMNYL